MTDALTTTTRLGLSDAWAARTDREGAPMTSPTSAPATAAARPCAGRAAALLAAAAPLAAALASSPAAVAFANVTPPAVQSRAHAAGLLSARALPATVCNPNPCDPKIPTLVGD